MGGIMDHHIDRHFDEALAALKQQIMLMGSKVEIMVADCMRALKEKDTVLADKIVDSDKSINALEVAIDEQCIELLARYQPAASDLRFITRGLKIVTDLERVGDLAVNCAQRIKQIIKEDHSGANTAGVDIYKMADTVQDMLKTSLTAFIEDNAALAEKVFARDDEVDESTEKYVTVLIEKAAKEPGAIKKIFPMTSLVRYLERIADHSTNIAELAIFMVSGHDVRHGRT
jgi:phosphate transport system protein